MGSPVDSPVDSPVGGVSEIGRFERHGSGGLREASQSNKQTPREIHSRFALVLTQSFNEELQPTFTTLTINSPHLLKALEEVVTHYPGRPSHFKQPVSIKSPFAILHHHKSLLQKYGEPDSDPTLRTHLKLLLDYLDSALDPHAEQLLSEGLVTFSLLWLAFRPGEVVVQSEHGHQQLWLLKKTAYAKSFLGMESFKLHCLRRMYNGTEVGWTSSTLQIEKSDEGVAEILSLDVSPLRCHRDPDSIKERLSERGYRYLEPTGIHVKHYDGMFLRLLLLTGQDKWLPCRSSGSVIVDGGTFVEENAGHHVRVVSDSEARSGALERQQGDPIRVQGQPSSGEDPFDAPIMFFPPYVHGYSLETRCWCRFFVDQLTEVRWRPNALSDLVLPTNQKTLIKSLVEYHSFKPSTTESYIEATKGKGLVILLHGGPGTGKTLTAEAMAEHHERPFLRIPAGELGDGLAILEKELKKLTKYATKWRAIVLIDEADIFLESRKDGSVERNALVAVFLRQLEYFQGIIFLTSNRAQTFDPAIKSRSHLILHYPPLDQHTRADIWRKRLQLIPEYDLDPELDIEEAITAVVGFEMDGREIANTVQSAQTLARSDGGPLGQTHLDTVMEVWRMAHDAQMVERLPN
ncbi:hypothetical protein RB597_007770 [Gaeumannomyces tritici]